MGTDVLKKKKKRKKCLNGNTVQNYVKPKIPFPSFR